MSKNSKDLTPFIINYWLRKEISETVTLLRLQQKERDQLLKIQRRRRRDLKKWFDIDIPEKNTRYASKGREKRMETIPEETIEDIEMKTKHQSVKIETTIPKEVPTQRRRFWSSLFKCFRS